jgi:hypothetical protein
MQKKNFLTQCVALHISRNPTDPTSNIKTAGQIQLSTQEQIYLQIGAFYVPFFTIIRINVNFNTQNTR